MFWIRHDIADSVSLFLSPDGKGEWEVKLAQPTTSTDTRNYCRQTFPVVGGNGDPPAALRRNPPSASGRDGKKERKGKDGMMDDG